MQALSSVCSRFSGISHNNSHYGKGGIRIGFCWVVAPNFSRYPQHVESARNDQQECLEQVSEATWKGLRGLLQQCYNAVCNRLPKKAFYVPSLIDFNVIGHLCRTLMCFSRAMFRQAVRIYLKVFRNYLKAFLQTVRI